VARRSPCRTWACSRTVRTGASACAASSCACTATPSTTCACKVRDAAWSLISLHTDRDTHKQTQREAPLRSPTAAHKHHVSRYQSAPIRPRRSERGDACVWHFSWAEPSDARVCLHRSRSWAHAAQTDLCRDTGMLPDDVVATLDQLGFLQRRRPVLQVRAYTHTPAPPSPPPPPRFPQYT
jgi:hypothetical protein